jgi:hypothetical protein
MVLGLLKSPLGRSLVIIGCLTMLLLAAKPQFDAAYADAWYAHHGKPKAHQPHKRGQRANPPPHGRALPAPPLTVVPADCAARLSPRQIGTVARRAGFGAEEAVTATAVALAESAGQVCAHNPVPPDDSYCLMQINMLGPLGPARRARFHLHRNTDLYDPATCMRVAYGISAGGTDWTPWTTWTRGTYRQFLDEAQAARR